MMIAKDPKSLFLPLGGVFLTPPGKVKTSRKICRELNTNETNTVVLYILYVVFPYFPYVLYGIKHDVMLRYLT